MAGLLFCPQDGNPNPRMIKAATHHNWPRSAGLASAAGIVVAPVGRREISPWRMAKRLSRSVTQRSHLCRNGWVCGPSPDRRCSGRLMLERPGPDPRLCNVADGPAFRAFRAYASQHAAVSAHGGWSPSRREAIALRSADPVASRGARVLGHQHKQSLRIGVNLWLGKRLSKLTTGDSIWSRRHSGAQFTSTGPQGPDAPKAAGRSGCVRRLRNP
jgi:hypothetical protein